MLAWRLRASTAAATIFGFGDAQPRSGTRFNKCGFTTRKTRESDGMVMGVRWRPPLCARGSRWGRGGQKHSSRAYAPRKYTLLESCPTTSV